MQDYGWAAPLIAIIAAGFTAWQAIEAGKSRRAAETSAKEAGAAQERIAKAIEQLNPSPETVWFVKHLKGQQYALRNDGDESAVGVKITTDSVHEPVSTFSRILPR